MKQKVKLIKRIAMVNAPHYGFLLLATVVTTACTPTISDKMQTSALHLTNAPYRDFQQLSGGSFDPPAYFSCDDNKSPCQFKAKINDMYSREKCKN